MDSFARKRVRPEASFNINGGVAGPKKFKQESESFQSGIGSKSKPCTKFFSTAGCPFGEGCHFLHYVPGGINAVSKMTSLPNTTLPPPMRNPLTTAPISDGPPPPSAIKTRLCNNYNTPEGCKFGDKCRFAHGEKELGKPNAPLDHYSIGGRAEPPPGMVAAASFGASATAKISVDASLAGAIIGKSGSNSKQICRLTGAKLSIRDHESDSSLKNIELEGTFDQIKQASAMVRELILNLGSSAPAPLPPRGPPLAGAGFGAPTTPGSNYKTKLCENFAKGSCTFGERCHFAHGTNELRKLPGI